MPTRIRIKHIFLAVLILALGASAPWAHAESRIVQFSATIFSSPFAIGALANSRVVTGSYTYDSDAATSDSGDNFADYTIAGATLKAMASTWSTNTSTIRVAHGVGVDLGPDGMLSNSDLYEVDMYSPWTGPAIQGYTMSSAILSLADTNESLYGGMIFPIDMPGLSFFEGAVLQLDLQSQTLPVAYVYAHINSMQFAPPPNVAPNVFSFTVPSLPILVGHATMVSASFTDPNAHDVHTAIFSWGDGKSSAGAVQEQPGGGVASAMHVYGSAGVYSPSVVVTDAAGLHGSGSGGPVVIYDPNGGEADGDGWINSPPGAFTPNPRLSGRMNFTFAPRYAHGATIPTGKTQFDAPPAGLKFNATSYDWLVVNGDRAQVKGGGTIDGVGSYVFLLTAIDGKVSKSGPDRLRLKVWDRATGSLIYDNQPGAADSAQVAAVGGGRIAIDK